MRKIMFLWLYVVAIVASLGGLLSGYDTGVISGALLFINDSWNLSDSMQGIVVSSVLIGAVIGAATNGVLADIFGRKKIIMATAVIFIVGSILCGFAPNVYVLIASRILVGLAVVLDQFVKIPVQANGGSISFAPVPLFIIAMRYGGLKGFIASGLFFGLITCLLDGYGFQCFPFDYFVALCGYGLIGTFVNFFNKFNKEKKFNKQYGLTIAGVVVGGILATIVRYFGHMVSGFILYAPISFVDNFIYQSTYVPLTMLVSIVVMCILVGPIILINRVFKVKGNAK